MILFLLAGKMSAAAGPDLQSELAALRKVDARGEGHSAAIESWQQVAEAADADDLPTILAAMDGANPLAENWLRAAVDTIAERQVKRDGKLPVDKLEAFLAESEHNPRARRLAYEWIARVDPTAPDRIIPEMLDDPSLELRRDAVARLIDSAAKLAEAEKNDAAAAEYRQALESARDTDQVKAITEALGELDDPVDLAHQYGFLVDWMVLGPFDNHEGKGFDSIYPPEETIDLKGRYPGLEAAVAWTPHHTDDEYGAVDLNKAIGKHMGVAGYALAEFISDEARPIELRVGSENAVKVWLNGKLLTSAEAYHANSAIDQYIGRGELKAGKNLILVKVCQDEQTVDWAQNWTFQLRVCDELGAAVLSADRPEPKSADELKAAAEAKKAEAKEE
ncbi:MAG: hypothetical protein DWQ37_23010 [Planctomycetota bacterium]|nr:MAG: hypothetical protein DWQ37_23010 [Planctomycetota bacterium]